MRQLLLIASAIASAAAQAASPCDGRALPEGPVPTGFEQADFGVVRRACPRTELGLSGVGRAVVEQENFYANLRGGARLDASMQPLPQLELFASGEGFVFNQVIQSYRATHMGLGDTSIGATLLAFARNGFALAPTARLDLPTALGLYQNSFPVGLEAGLLGLVVPFEELRLHGGLLGAATWAVTAADSDDRGAIISNVGADLVLDDWVAVVADLNAQALHRADLDRLTVGLGARFAFFDGLGLELGAVIPVAGAERNLASFVLRGAWRFQ
ncbi:MAG: hypothetical protein A2138_18635 [Deltaproteobacteria bacterium RBG_16_71_12]|nr:MAG: hypothetical protein A2138_18635 [Deltaproteobacteria bacterium RBG_16_71_12]